jgi:hypothetical protein
MAPIARADDPKDEKPKDEKPVTPAEEYQALLKEFQNAEQAFFKQYQELKTDEERGQFFEKYPIKEFVGKFMEFAEKHRKDSSAIDALMWVVQRGRATDPATSKAWETAVDILIREHIESERIGDVAQSMVYSNAAKAEQFLRTAIAKSPHAEVQGQACMALAQYLKGLIRTAEYLRGPEGKENLQQMQQYYGKEMLQRLTTIDLAEFNTEVESLCQRVIEKYADVKHWRGTLGKAAEGELFEIRNLAIGKVAPDIEGEDI